MKEKIAATEYKIRFDGVCWALLSVYKTKKGVDRERPIGWYFDLPAAAKAMLRILVARDLGGVTVHTTLQDCVRVFNECEARVVAEVVRIAERGPNTPTHVDEPIVEPLTQ